MKSFIVLFFIVFTSMSWGQNIRAGWINLPQSKARLITDYSTVVPGQNMRVGLEIQLDRNWHTYAEDPGQSGAPPTFDLLLPVEFKIGPILFPPYEVIKSGNIVTYGYHNKVIFIREVKIPEKIEPGSRINIQSKVEYLVCKDTCIPALTDFSFFIEVDREAKLSPNFSSFEKAYESPKDFKSNMFILFFAFIGGMLLNLMPCVFPVLSLKAIQISEIKNRLATPFYVLGVLVSLWALTLVLVLLRQSGEMVGWGFQLQSPSFVAFLAALFTLLALNLFGIFEMGGRLQNFGSSWTSRHVYAHEFLSGILTVVVAAPCSAPFMGAAVGYALSQNAVTIFVIMTALGLGLSFPFILLAAFPYLKRHMPRAGGWMENFKILMGFPLLITAIWMCWLLVQLKNPLFAFFTIACLVLGGFWLSWAKLSHRLRWIRLFSVLSLVFFILPIAQSLNSETKVEAKLPWIEFSFQKFQDLESSGQLTFVDFTADWCLSCKVNEAMTFQDQSVIEFIQKNNMVIMKADWTKKNPEITAALSKYQRAGVPFYLVIKGKNQMILPEILTPNLFKDRITEFITQQKIDRVK